MYPSSMVRVCALVSMIVGACGLAACSSNNGPSGGAGSGSSGSTGSGSSGSSGSGSGSSESGSSSGAPDGGGSGSVQDAGTPDSGAEGGVRDVGSCCTAQTTPGCEDPNLELCVCKANPDCCTKQWSLGCAYYVQDRYCEPSVQACVCGTDAGQAGQTSCCGNWTSFCDSVAIVNCQAPKGCF